MLGALAGVATASRHGARFPWLTLPRCRPPHPCREQKAPEDGTSAKDLYLAAYVLEHAGKVGSHPAAACKSLNKWISGKNTKVPCGPLLHCGRHCCAGTLLCYSRGESSELETPCDARGPSLCVCRGGFLTCEQVGKLSFAIRAASSLGCLEAVPESAVATLQNGIESGKVADVYAVTSVLSLLPKKGKELTILWSGVVDDIADLSEVPRVVQCRTIAPGPGPLLPRLLLRCVLLSECVRVAPSCAARAGGRQVPRGKGQGRVVVGAGVGHGVPHLRDGVVARAGRPSVAAGHCCVPVRHDAGQLRQRVGVGEHAAG